MAGGGHRILKAGMLILAVLLLLLGAFMALVTARELARSDYGGALVGTVVAALPVWGGVWLVRTARRRFPSRVRGGRSDTWARTGTHGRQETGRVLSRGRRIVRICCSVPLLLGSGYLLIGAVLSFVQDKDGRLTGLLLGFGLLAGQYGLRLTGLVRSSGSSGGGGGVDGGGGGGHHGCGGGAGCGAGGGCGAG